MSGSISVCAVRNRLIADSPAKSTIHIQHRAHLQKARNLSFHLHEFHFVDVMVPLQPDLFARQFAYGLLPEETANCLLGDTAQTPHFLLAARAAKRKGGPPMIAYCRLDKQEESL